MLFTLGCQSKEAKFSRNYLLETHIRVHYVFLGYMVYERTD